MAVLLEAFSVVVRNETIEAKYPGGMKGYWVDCMYRSFCCDEYVTRVGFREFRLMRQFVQNLLELGIRVEHEDEFIEVAIIDQLFGMQAGCRWLTIAHHPDGFVFAALRGDLSPEVHKPSGWCHAGSLSEWAERMRADGVDTTDPVAVAAASIDESDDQSTEMIESTENRVASDRLASSATREDPESPVRWLSDRHIETHASHLVATYGDTTRPVWVIEPYGEAYLIGDRRVRDIPELQATTPANCLLIAAVEPGDLVGVVMPAYRLDDAGDDGLTQSQRFALTCLPQACSATKSEPSHRWWNPWHWCQRWLGSETS